MDARPFIYDAYAWLGLLTQGTWLVLAWGLGLGLAAWAAWRLGGILPGRTGNWPKADRWVLAGVLLLLALLRLPDVLLPALDDDEHFWLVGATTLWADPRPWLAWDGSTSGPLVAMLPWVARPLAHPLEHGHLRLVNLVATLLLAWGYLRLARTRWGLGAAWLAAWPLLVFLGLHGTGLFRQYNGEWAVLLLVGGFWAVVAQWPAKGLPGIGLALGTGALLGLLPYAKLQAVPIGAALGLWVAWPLLVGRAWRPLATLVAGGVLPTVLVVAAAAAYGGLADFWTGYLAVNLAQAGGAHPAAFSWPEAWAFLPDFLFAQREMGFLNRGLAAAMLLALVPAVWFWRRLPTNLRADLLLGGLVLGAVLYAVLKSRCFFGHYLLLLPIAWAHLWGPMAACLHWAWHQPQALRGLARGATAALLGVLMVGLPLRQMTNVYPNGLFVKPEAYWPPAQHHTVPHLAAIINHRAQPGDWVGTWGPGHSLAAHTHLPVATRQNHQGLPGAFGFGPQLQAYFRQRFVEDLARRQPRFLLDAVTDQVGPGYLQPTIHRHEAFPALRPAWAPYRLVAQHQGIRLYERVPPHQPPAKP